MGTRRTLDPVLSSRRTRGEPWIRGVAPNGRAASPASSPYRLDGRGANPGFRLYARAYAAWAQGLASGPAAADVQDPGFVSTPSGNPGFVSRPFRNPGFVPCPSRVVFRPQTDTRRTPVSQMDRKRTRDFTVVPRWTRGEPGIPSEVQMDMRRTLDQGRSSKWLGGEPGIPSGAPMDTRRTLDFADAPRWTRDEPGIKPAPTRGTRRESQFPPARPDACGMIPGRRLRPCGSRCPRSQVCF